jgi:glycosyltransferase involved in cell wall biosynthesis
VRVVRVITRLNRGGPLRQLEALVPGLARRGVSGPVWTGAPAAGEEDRSGDLRALGVEVVRVPGLRRGISPPDDLRAFAWMRARLRRERPDVVHTHLAKAGALGRLAARAAGVPVVVHTFHGHHLVGGRAVRTGARLAERALAGVSTAAVCLSPSQRRDLVDVHRVLEPAPAVVVGPGIDLEAFRARVDPERAAAIRARHAPPGGVLFLWLGRLVAAKDPALAVEAAERAASGAAVPLRLALAGGGPLRRAVGRAAARGAVVSVVGPVPDPWDWLAASDAVLLSSRSEGTPIAAVEAAALGVPVLSTAVGGVADVVGDGETGLLVPPGDPAALAAAMVRLATDRALRERLGGAARDRSARFDGARLVAETSALYARRPAGSAL